MNEKLIDAIEFHKAAKKAKHDADMAYIQALAALRDALQDCGVEQSDLKAD